MDVIFSGIDVAIQRSVLFLGTCPDFGTLLNIFSVNFVINNQPALSTSQFTKKLINLHLFHKPSFSIINKIFVRL